MYVCKKSIHNTRLLPLSPDTIRNPNFSTHSELGTESLKCQAHEHGLSGKGGDGSLENKGFCVQSVVEVMSEGITVRDTMSREASLSSNEFTCPVILIRN